VASAEHQQSFWILSTLDRLGILIPHVRHYIGDVKEDNATESRTIAGERSLHPGQQTLNQTGKFQKVLVNGAMMGRQIV
jgi:hypothetical protein